MGISRICSFVVNCGRKYVNKLVRHTNPVKPKNVDSISFKPLTKDTVEISKTTKTATANTAEKIAKQFALADDAMKIERKNAKSVDDILDTVITPGEDVYFDASKGKLAIEKTEAAKTQALRTLEKAHLQEKQRALDTINRINEKYKTELEVYERLRQSAPKLNGNSLDEILKKSPNITADDIIQACYAKTPEAHRPTKDMLDEAVDILNNKSELLKTGKKQKAIIDDAEKAAQKAEKDFNGVKEIERKNKINDTKKSIMTELDDGNYQINIVSPLEGEKGIYDIIKITKEDKKMYEDIIRTRYSDLVNPDLSDPKAVHAMHRLLQRYAGATDKATPVNFEEMTKFLDKIKDIKANPTKYNITGGVPQLANGDIRLGFHLVRGQTSRGGCALAIPNGKTYDMIILGKDGKITSTISGVKQSAIDSYFKPIQVAD